MSRLEDELRQIEAMDKAALVNRWAKLTGLSVPKVSTAILRQALAYELQTRALGNLSRQARQCLNAAIGQKAVVRQLRPGMRLAREHGGIMHVVTIGKAGQIFWNDREWRSLSEVARAITGTRWSGPAFFGLRSAA